MERGESPLPYFDLQQPAPSIVREGNFSGYWFEAFETSWFQPDGTREIWWFWGPAVTDLAGRFEDDRVFPYNPDHPDYDFASLRPLDESVYPYLCIHVVFHGQYEKRPDHWQARVEAKRVLEAEVVDRKYEDCIRQDWR